MSSVALWFYRHYRGGIYEVIGSVIMSSNDDNDGMEYVLYKSITHVYNPIHPIEYPDGTMFVRYVEQFVSDVMYQGQILPRFTYLWTDAGI